MIVGGVPLLVASSKGLAVTDAGYLAVSTTSGSGSVALPAGTESCIVMGICWSRLGSAATTTGVTVAGQAGTVRHRFQALGEYSEDVSFWTVENIVLSGSVTLSITCGSPQGYLHLYRVFALNKSFLNTTPSDTAGTQTGVNNIDAYAGGVVVAGIGGISPASMTYVSNVLTYDQGGGVVSASGALVPTVDATNQAINGYTQLDSYNRDCMGSVSYSADKFA